MAAFCTACSSATEPAARFCTNCGAPAATVREDPPPSPALAAAPSRAVEAAPPPPYAPRYAPAHAAYAPPVPPTAYPALRVARVACRIAAVLSLLGGLGALLAGVAIGNQPGIGGAGGLGAVGGIFALILSGVYAVMLWALADLIAIALRLEPTLPVARRGA